MAYVRKGGHGGPREGSGRKLVSAKKANPQRERVVAAPKLKPPTVPAEAKKPDGLDARVLAEMLPQLAEISRINARQQPRTRQNCPFILPKIARHLEPPEDKGGGMAMDTALVQNLDACATDWLSGGAPYGIGDQGLQFLGYPYLAELAQRPEYRVMAETIADDATRKWIDFDVTGDEKQQREAAAKDPAGHAERTADPDEQKKRVAAAGKSDKVKALQDDQLRLGVKDRFYEQSRNGSFFGRSHLFLDVWTGDVEPSPEELVMPIGDGRDKTSESKVPKGSFKALRTIEAMWAYPQVYNAINPLKADWYNPQQWYVMGQGVHVSRLQTFIPHPVPDMLKPAYAFGGLSLTQMAKPYVDIWLQTKQSVAELIHSFSVMVLMTDLSTLMTPGSAAGLIARAVMFNMMRDNQGLFLANKNTEDFKNVSASLSGLHELQAQAQEHVASVHRIPLVKFTGIQPAGLNASSEGEIKVYDDTITAYESRVFDPHLSRVINFQQLSLFGEIDPQITHRWEPLREMTQAEKGQKEKDDAERNQKYVDMGAISPAEVRKAIINDKDLPYTGLDPDDVPELDEEEDNGLEPGGKKPGGGEPDDDRGGGASDAAIPFGADAWSEADHPRGQPENAGQFGPGGGGSSPGGSEGSKSKKAAPEAQKSVDLLKRKYGGLYKQTGKGAKADHLATVEHVLKNPPRAGVSYRELLTRLVKDAPELGGDVDQLKQHLGQAYENARQQLRLKALVAPSNEEAVRLEKMAERAAAKAEALGFKAPAPAPAASWTSDYDASPELSRFREGTQRYLVDRGVKSGLEDVTGFDLRTGKPLAGGLTNKRQARNVQFSQELMEEIRDPSNEIELHHNHPSDVSLSIPDLEVIATQPGLARIYAHGHAGSTYSVTGASPNVRGAYNAAGNAIYGQIAGLPLAAADKSRLHHHVILTALDDVGLVEGYRAQLEPVSAAWLSTRKALFKHYVGLAGHAARRQAES